MLLTLCKFENMYKISILGNGNLGYKFANIIDSLDDFCLLEWYGRKWINDIIPKKGINDIEKLKKADLYILAVSDSSIEGLSNYLDYKSFIVHCSGATSISVFKNHARCGVLFPVQSISKSNHALFDETPFCIEAKNNADLNILKKLVINLNGTFMNFDSDQRAKIHLSAVWVNNFVNHMIYKGKKTCEENNIPFSVLKPIIKNTINQTLTNDPFKIQTGPAIRNDKITIKNHCELLGNEIDKKLYKTITNSIQKSHDETKLQD